MRTLLVLAVLSIAMTCQAAAQSVVDATNTNLPAARENRGGVTRPTDNPACAPWLGSCIRQDSSRVLLLLSVVGAGKRPLILR